MPFRISVNSSGLKDPEHVSILDNSGDPQGGGLEIRMEDHSQPDPAGRFRIRVDGDSFTLEQSTAAEWADSVALLTISGKEVELTLPDDDVAEALAALLLETRSLREYVELATA